MTKTLNQIIFFSFTKIRIFFSATLGIRIFFLEKNHTPPFKLNGRSLIDSLWYIQKDRISVQYPECLERNHTELYRYRKHMYKVYLGRSSSVDVYYSYCITFRKKYSLRFSISHVMGFIPTKLSQISDLVNLGSCCMCLTMKCWRRFSKLLL